MLVKAYGREAAGQIMPRVQKEFEALCAENAQEPKAVRAHTWESVYPCIAFYRALQQEGIKKEDAYTFLFDAFAARAEKGAAQMRTLFKLPGLYKLMPFFWKVVTKSSYGEAAGFKYSFYPTGRDRVKFDMTECTYCRTFERYGCRELTSIFCHLDDVNNENLHPKLLWNRSKTMGAGADCCDFDVIVKH